MSLLTSMLRPRTVAVIGASATRAAQGNVVLANLRRTGYSGVVTVVHPRATVVDGVKAVPSIQDLPDGIDVAVVCVPARVLTDTIFQLEAIGCPAAIAVAAGFTEAEDRRLRTMLAHVDIALSGPNCMGMINLTDSISLYTARYRESLPVGNAALIAQSGSAAIALANHQGIGFSKIITSGNEYGVIAADYLDWLASDPHTHVVGLVAESIHDPRHFEAAVQSLHSNGKAIVVLKVGLSALGARATIAHTGAMVGRDEAFTDYFRRLGVPRVRDYDELGAALQCLSIPKMRSKGRRVGVISISGGQGALACDVAFEEGIELATLSSTTSQAIKEWLPGSTGCNPLDLGASVGGAARRLDALKAFVADPGVDAVAVIQDAQGTLPIHEAHDYIPHIRHVVEIADLTDTPVTLISSTSADTHPMLTDLVAGSRVPMLRGLRSGFAGLRAIMDSRIPEFGRDVAEFDGMPTGATIEQLRGELERERGGVSREMSLKLLKAYGIPFVRSAVVADEDEAARAALKLGFPLVVKAVSPGLAHKSDAGGVVTGVLDEASLRAAIKAVRGALAAHEPTARVEGFELQEMVKGGVEAVVGFTTDLTLGLLLMVGTGGVLVELANDHASRLAPVCEADAEEMIRSTHLGRMLCGYRNLMTPTKLSGLKAVLCRLSQLASDFDGAIVEADLNPVIVAEGSGRSVVVDVLFVVGDRQDHRDS